jgi:GntR family transcriptional repressor for pyruvate dehydrogenase complex
MVETTFQPVRRTSLPDAIYAELWGRITRGDMEPGTVLPSERELATLLNVNRQAVREALKRLEQAHMVAIQQGGQTRVLNYLDTAGTDVLAQLLLTSDGRLRVKVIRSVLEMRAALAPDIARLAAQRASKAVHQGLADTVVLMRQSSADLGRLQTLSMTFWGLLVEGADNVAYRLAFNSLRETYDKVRGLLLEPLRDELTASALFASVANAVRDGDADAAERKARTLIRKGTEPLLMMVEQLGNLGEKP